MDDDDMYDEFGNLIGGSEDEYVSEEEVVQPDQSTGPGSAPADIESKPTEPSQIVKYENNANGMTLKQRFGPEVTTVIPHQPEISEPVINPEIKRKGKVDFTDNVIEDEIADVLPPLNYSRDYMISTALQLPERIRNVAFVGGFHSGKTSLVDVLVLQTHTNINLSTTMKNYHPLRFTDNHRIEIDRGVSIKSSFISLLLQDGKSKSHMFNIVDTPGHPNFADETSAALEAADAIVLVVDAVEGLTFRDRDILTEAIKSNLQVTLVLNKIDRLVLELRLPVIDAYFKLAHVVHEVNDFIRSNEYVSTYTHDAVLSPEKNNVIFASASLQFSFTLKSFTKLYFENNSELASIDEDVFQRQLWGDRYFSTQENKFTKSSNNGSNQRTFCHFILEPLYKIFTSTLTRDAKSKTLSNILWQNFGVSLPKELLLHDSQILLREIFELIFPTSAGFVDSVINNSQSGAQIQNLLKDEEQLVAKIIKLVETADGESFNVCVKIIQGSIKAGGKVKVLGDNFEEDSEDYRVQIVKQILVPGGRYSFPIKEATKGFVVLLSGIDETISKPSTLYGATTEDSDMQQLARKSYTDASVYKLAIEPSNPSELPKLLKSLRKVNKAYLSSVVKIEDSGEHTIFAPGELVFDCILHDIRLFFADNLQIRVSNPMVKLGETASETSVTKISTASTTGENKISIIAEPVNDNRLSKAIYEGRIDLSQPAKVTAKILRTEFEWDSLAARSVWAFGPDDLKQPNILLDDTLEDETDKDLLLSVKDSITLGFKWSANEGPLCDEPIRNTKFKILDAVLSGSSVQRSGAQIIPLTRRACYTGFLTASPRLLEPVYRVHATCTYRATHAIGKILSKRRGEVWTQDAIPGTQLFNIEGRVPVIESIGLETDIRLQTQGQAMCFLDFNDWAVAPGDPLDSQCHLPDLEPVPVQSIARDFVMKTRRRKGLSGEPSLQKYIDSELFEKLKSVGLV